MDISILIDSVDRSNIINFGTVRKTDSLNSEVDILEFGISKKPLDTFTPTVNSDVKMYDGTTLMYGGVITQVDISPEGDQLLVYKVQCKDYSHHLDRNLVLERYEDKTCEEIIDDMITKYASGFTTTNVNASTINFDVVTLDRLSVSQCLTRLAKQVNYSWYVDYEKDIHFIPKNDESAPFDITDTSDNYIFDSLKLTYDFTQIRNRIIVKGGEAESNERTEYLSGTGTNTAFPLAYKFSSLPVVVQGSTTLDVGIDGLDNDADFDVLWNYMQKYLRFVTAPASGTDNVSVTGIPLLPITVIVSDSPSMNTYGIYEYTIQEKRLSTRDDAIQYGNGELEAYKDPQIDANFETYTSGVRSGQILNIDSDLRNIDEDFLVQRVIFEMESPTVGVWKVQMSTLRTLTLTKILQELFTPEESSIDDLESLYGLLTFNDPATCTDALGTPTTESPPYYYTSSANDGEWNFCTWS